MHPKLTLKQLAKACGGQILREGLSNDVSVLAFDSRKLAEPDRTVFFALKSATNDGLRYLDDAYRKGVRTFVVPRNFYPDKRLSEASLLKPMIPCWLYKPWQRPIAVFLQLRCWVLPAVMAKPL